MVFFRAYEGWSNIINIGECVRIEKNARIGNVKEKIEASVCSGFILIILCFKYVRTLKNSVFTCHFSFLFSAMIPVVKLLFHFELWQCFLYYECCSVCFWRHHCPSFGEWMLFLDNNKNFSLGLVLHIRKVELYFWEPLHNKLLRGENCFCFVSSTLFYRILKNTA